MTQFPFAILIASSCILLGGILGALLGHKIPQKIRKHLPMMFCLSSMAMGISCIMKMQTMPAVILAILLGCVVGDLCRIQEGIQFCANKMREPLEKIMPNRSTQKDPDRFMTEFVSLVVLFCVSSTGIYGSLQYGMTGDQNILLAKAILDFFTAFIFAASLGYLVAFIAVPEMIIFLALFYGATFLTPFLTPTILGDFSACGGIILLGTGFTIGGLRDFPTASMIPAMIFVFPLSYLWNLLPF